MIFLKTQYEKLPVGLATGAHSRDVQMRPLVHQWKAPKKLLLQVLQRIFVLQQRVAHVTTRA